ncbi:hypothetical protein EGW08_010004 [Elysia chlorotica]|uniref:Fibrinogen C-terminal domain-containing protein n=1 Tax=Elysia chlorotica TaxID=188477 RepID=A0A433TKY7_ELYCH|nr:hypothetical protein EGW08_010004 [Elysia chlorotica]
MKRNASIVIGLWLVLCCQGLDLTMERGHHGVLGTRSLCGVLICEETINASVSSSSGKDDSGSSIVFGSISSMSVFKTKSTSPKVDSRSNHETLLGSVTSQTPSVTRVANGRKIDGLLKDGKARIRVELLKEEDCQAKFSCQVRGLDIQGREVISSTSLIQSQVQNGNWVKDGGVMPGQSLQVFALLQQLVSQSVGKLEDRIELLSKEMSDKSDKLENRVEDRIGQLHTQMNDKLESLQKHVNDRTDAFEIRIDNRLNFFENRVEDKIDNNNNLNELIQLDSKVSSELAQFRIEAKADIRNSLDSLRQSFQHDQGEVLKNASEQLEITVNNTSSLLSSMASHFDWLKTYDELNFQSMRNQTHAIHEMLASGEIMSQCLKNDTTASGIEYLPVVCQRGMRDTSNATYPKYAVVPQFTLQRDILCDTETDGGGWTVIQRRTKGDVFFNRDWESHKNGFGQVDGDFWLGNDAVHILTYVQPHELRVEIQSEGKDYFVHYDTFKIENESDK